MRVLAKRSVGNVFSLKLCYNRAPDLAAQLGLYNKQVVDRLLSPLKCQKG